MTSSLKYVASKLMSAHYTHLTCSYEGSDGRIQISFSMNSSSGARPESPRALALASPVLLNSELMRVKGLLLTLRPLMSDGKKWQLFYSGSSTNL